MKLIEPYEKLAVHITEAMFVVVPISKEVHTAVCTPHNNGPTSTLCILIAAHYPRMLTVMRNYNLIDPRATTHGSCLETVLRVLKRRVLQRQFVQFI